MTVEQYGTAVRAAYEAGYVDGANHQHVDSTDAASPRARAKRYAASRRQAA